MTKFLVTHSLHSSWRFYKALDGKTDQDFLNTLNKVREPDNEAMALGRKFEDDVLSVCLGKKLHEESQNYTDCVNDVAETVSGGLWQEPVYRDVKIHGMDILLYGRADIIKKDWVYDIKFTKHYELGKYTKSIQHSLYMFCTGIENFGYLVSDGTSYWKEDYHMSEELLNGMRGEVSTMIEEIMANKAFKEAFLKNWQAK